MELKELFEKINQNLERPLTPLMMERLADFVKLDGMAVEVLYEAFASAVEQEADKPMTYMLSVLRVWRKSGIKTLDDVEAEREAFETRKGQGKPSVGSVPAWSQPDYRNETSQSERDRLEIYKRQRLAELDGKTGNR